MKRRHGGATCLFEAVLTMVAAVVGVTGAAAEGGGQKQFPCTSSTIRAAHSWPTSCPTTQLVADDHVVWRDPPTHQFLLAFSAGMENLGAGTMNAVGYIATPSHAPCRTRTRGSSASAR